MGLVKHNLIPEYYMAMMAKQELTFRPGNLDRWVRR